MSLTDSQLQQFLQATKQEIPPLLEFRAGAMELKGRTVTADPRRGLISLMVDEEGILHFQWKLRPSNQVEQQYFVFPKLASFTRVSECKDGRVYLLKFQDSEVKRFWWMQEPKADNDEELARKVNEIIQNPPKYGQAMQFSTPPAANNGASPIDSTSTMELTSRAGLGAGGVVGVVSRNEPAASERAPHGAVLHPATAAAATASSAAATSSSTSGGAGQIDANQLLSTLNSIAQQLAAAQQQQNFTLIDVLEPDRVVPILDTDSALVEALVQYLPEGQRNPQALRDSLRSPQLQQTLARLTSILNGPNFGQLLASWSLPLNTGAGVSAFLQAIEQQVNKQKEQKDDQNKQ